MKKSLIQKSLGCLRHGRLYRHPGPENQAAPFGHLSVCHHGVDFSGRVSDVPTE